MTPPKKPICLVKPSTHSQPLQESKRDDQNIYTISLEGLSQGTTEAQVLHCIRLLEHVHICNVHMGTCSEGESCRRTKQVLLHHTSCKSRSSECSACHQFLALCRNHSDNCQETKGNCNVLYCKNKKINQISSDHTNQLSIKIQQNNIFMKEQKTKSFEEVIKKFLNLPIEQQKINIARVLETNPEVTKHILRKLMCAQRSGSLLSKMTNLTMSRRNENVTQKSINPPMNSTIGPCSMRLNVVVRALASRLSCKTRH